MTEKTKTLTDLNDHLFKQIERLNNPDLQGDRLYEEVNRTGSLVSLAGKVIDNARLALDAEVKLADMPAANRRPKMLNNAEKDPL